MIKLYTTHCPQCGVLEKLLKLNNIKYESISDETIMRNKGILSVPVLEVAGELMNTKDAVQWISGKVMKGDNE